MSEQKHCAIMIYHGIVLQSCALSPRSLALAFGLITNDVFSRHRRLGASRNAFTASKRSKCKKCKKMQKCRGPPGDVTP